MKSEDLEAKIQVLETRRTELGKQKDLFEVPCPDCKKNIRGIPVDPNGNAECPHCCASITREDVQSYQDQLNDLWYDLCRTASEISVLHTRRHVKDLYFGLKPWRKFLRNRLQRKDFTPALYKMLSHTFHNIAHMNEGGFYHNQFDDKKMQIATLQRMIAHVASHPEVPPPTDKGHGRFYQALEKKIAGEIDVSGVLTRLVKEDTAEDEAKDRAEYERLSRKYEVHNS